MEMGSTFRSQMPRFPTGDPDYRMIRLVPSRFLHYYFYIRDPVIGPLSMCVGVPQATEALRWRQKVILIWDHLPAHRSPR